MSNNGNNSDLVELRALKVAFEFIRSNYAGDKLRPERGHFVMSERWQDWQEEWDEEGASVRVTFNSAISAETVIRRLKQVIVDIKSDGLPQPTLLVPRKIATEFINHNETEETFFLLEFYISSARNRDRS